jgi:hypothetical protein
MNFKIIKKFCLYLSRFNNECSVSTTFYMHISFLIRYKIPPHNRLYIISSPSIYRTRTEWESVIHNDISSKSQADGYCWLIVYLMKCRVSGLGVIIHYKHGGIYKLQINDLSWEISQHFRYDEKKGKQKVSVYDDTRSRNPPNRKI